MFPKPEDDREAIKAAAMREGANAYFRPSCPWYQALLVTSIPEHVVRQERESTSPQVGRPGSPVGQVHDPGTRHAVQLDGCLHQGTRLEGGGQHIHHMCSSCKPPMQTVRDLRGHSGL